MLPPFNFKKWIDENRHLLKPPVGNKEVYKDHRFIVMVVGGPNSRTDYHINEGEEFFYQIEGDMNLRILEQGKPKDIPIREGEIFLLHAKVPHCPQRPANTVGLVIEHKRHPGEMDGFRWMCPNCNEMLYEEFVEMTNIETQMPPIFDRFFSNPANCTCKKCGTKMEKKKPA